METSTRTRAAQLAGTTLMLAFMAETTAMLALPGFGEGLPEWLLPVADAALMTALMFPPLILVVVLPLVREIEASQAARETREARLLAESQRQQFEAQLGRALAIVETEAEVLDVARRALIRIVPGTRAELLLADSSDAHLRPALRLALDTCGACPVESPRRCIAARRGQTLRFEDSESFDACGMLRDREIGPCSATCVPMSVMGKVVGVIHLATPAGQPSPQDAVSALESIANQVGTRLGITRSVASMQVQAATDPLTGLLNRRSFEAAVAPLLASGRRFSLAVADLDNFKRLNDTYGHEAGDRALRAFSRTIRTTLRADDVIGRIGGEEFAIVLPDCTVEAAARALEGVRAALVTTLTRGGVPPFTVSMGLVDSDSAEDLEALVAAGDKALYQAKRDGRDRIVISGRGEVVPTGADRTPALVEEAVAAH